RSGEALTLRVSPRGFLKCQRGATFGPPLLFMGRHLGLWIPSTPFGRSCPAKGQLARKRVISALIQQANLLPVEPLFFDLKISAQDEAEALPPQEELPKAR